MPPMFRIPVPAWARTLPEDRSPTFPPADCTRIQALQAQVDAEVERQVQRYFDEVPTDGLFPDLLRLTGEFYIGARSYSHVHPPWFGKLGRRAELHFSVMARCLEHPGHAGQADRDDLGLEVHFRWHAEEGAFEWVATDSSSI